MSCVTCACRRPCTHWHCPASRPSFFSSQRTLESGQAFSQRQLEQVPPASFPASFLHILPARCVVAGCDLTATFQNRELVEIVRALQGEREGLLGELSDALQVMARNHRVAACADVACLLQRMQMMESDRTRLAEVHARAVCYAAHAKCTLTTCAGAD